MRVLYHRDSLTEAVIKCTHDRRVLKIDFPRKRKHRSRRILLNIFDVFSVDVIAIFSVLPPITPHPRQRFPQNCFIVLRNDRSSSLTGYCLNVSFGDIIKPFSARIPFVQIGMEFKGRVIKLRCTRGISRNITFGGE